MVKIENKEIDFKMIFEENKGPENVTYAHLIGLCINRPRERGWSIEDIRKEIRILDKLQDLKPGDIIEFEDSDFLNLKDYVITMKEYPLRHKGVIEFETYITTLLPINNI